MTRITWNTRLETGLPALDEQHQRLFQILDGLTEQAERGRVLSPTEVEAVVGELADYARHHFAHEIQLMLAARCDLRHIQTHVREHENFIRHVSLVREALDDSRNDEGAQLARYLAEWFTGHIAGLDLSMARQLQRIAQGETPEAAYLAETSGAAAALAPVA